MSGRGIRNVRLGRIQMERIAQAGGSPHRAQRAPREDGRSRLLANRLDWVKPGGWYGNQWVRNPDLRTSCDEPLSIPSGSEHRLDQAVEVVGIGLDGGFDA